MPYHPTFVMTWQNLNVDSGTPHELCTGTCPLQFPPRLCPAQRAASCTWVETPRPPQPSSLLICLIIPQSSFGLPSSLEVSVSALQAATLALEVGLGPLGRESQGLCSLGGAESTESLIIYIWDFVNSSLSFALPPMRETCDDWKPEFCLYPELL